MCDRQLISAHLHGCLLVLLDPYTCLEDSHSVRRLNADGDLLVDVGDTISRILERMHHGIVNLALLTHLF